MMLLGMVWAVFAPLLLVPPMLLAHRGLRAWCGTRVRASGLRAAAVAVVLVPVAAVWAWQRSQFEAVCRHEGAAVVTAKARADGFLLESTTANSFGPRYLYDDGFQWFEARDVSRRDGWVRYERDAAGAIASRPIDTPTARYEVRETHGKPHSHTSLMVTRVSDRQTGAELSRAASAYFDGGSMMWALGAWGGTACPNAMWDAEGFRRYYHLVRDTLR